MATRWLLHLAGKGRRVRSVPVPSELVEEFGDELVRQGFEPQPNALSNRGVPLMARFNVESGQPTSWSASGLYRAIKGFLAYAAEGLEEADAHQLQEASTQWLRHARAPFGSTQGKEGTNALLASTPA
jgi:hypothetical protein